MTNQASQILNDIVGTLRTCGAFVVVGVDLPGSVSQSPRACVTQVSLNFTPAEDRPTGVWGRLRARVAIHCRCDDDSSRIHQLNELAETARSALLDDPHRGDLCTDLSQGRATEIGHIEQSDSVRRPQGQVNMDVWCHFESQEAL